MNLRHIVISLFLLSSFAPLASAQSGKFSCDPKKGVRCLSAQEVYRATESLSSLEAIDTPKEEAALSAYLGAAQLGVVANDDGALILMTQAPKISRAQAKANPPLAPEPYVPMAPAPTFDQGAEPFRMPAQVMRIWLAPWEDESGDLHMPGFVYTEIQGRRWSVAEPAPATAPRLQLVTPDAVTTNP